MSTPALGMGLCPMGSSPFGFGVPADRGLGPPRLLIQQDGSQGDVVLLDTTTGDYVLDELGDKVGWNAVEQMIYLATHTVRGRSAVAVLGIRLPFGVLREDIAQRNRQAVEEALRPMVTQGLIQIVDVLTTRVGASGAQIELRWRRLPVGSVQSTFL